MEGMGFSTYQLKYMAYQWYKERDQARGNDILSSLQEDCYNAFLDHFFPYELRKVKAEELFIMKKDKMSVKEFSLHFNQLSQYALELAFSMRARMQKFSLIFSRDNLREKGYIVEQAYVILGQFYIYKRQRKKKQQVEI